MRNKALDTHLRLLDLQLDSWKRLHDLITYGLDKAKPELLFTVKALQLQRPVCLRVLWYF